MTKDNSCRLIFWMLLGLTIWIFVLWWIFNSTIEREKRFIREFNTNQDNEIVLEKNKTYLLYERLK